MWCIYLQSDWIKRNDVWSKSENENKIPVAGYLMTPKKLKDTSKYVNSDTVFKVYTIFYWRWIYLPSLFLSKIGKQFIAEVLQKWDCKHNIFQNIFHSADCCYIAPE